MGSLRNEPTINFQLFQPTIELIKEYQQQFGGRVFVGYSGGVDSHTLLHLCQLNGIVNLHAIHINHQLQAEANSWQQHCQQQCQALGVPFITEKITASPRQGESIEAFARHFRYQLIAKHIQAGDLLLSGHHQQDQAETFLLQLMRGAGVDGLKSMPLIKPFAKGHYLRPLLNVTKQQIEDYAAAQQLDFMTDSSNADNRFARNYLRKEVIPVLERRWPKACQSIATSAHWLQEIEITKTVERPTIRHLLTLPVEQQKAKVRGFIKAKIGYSLSTNETHYVLQHFLHARVDRHPQLQLGQFELRRHQSELHLIQTMSKIKLQIMQIDINQIKLKQKSQLNKMVGIVWQQGSGINIHQLAATITIRTVNSAERFHPYNRGKSQTIKKLMQEKQIPVWLRSQCYGLYSGEELLAILGLGVSKKYHQINDNCYFPEWQIAPEFVSI